MESNPAFVRAKRTIELHPESAVNPYLSIIVHPWYAKHNHPFRFDKLFQYAFIHIGRIFCEDRAEGLKYVLNGLMKFCFIWVSLCYFFINLVHILLNFIFL